MFASRPLLIIASSVALFLWVWVFAGIAAYYYESLNVLYYLWLAYPFIYLTISIYCGFVRVSPRRLLMTGVVIHFPVVATLVYTFTEAGFEIWPGTLVCLAFAVLWCARVWHAHTCATQ